MRILVLLIGLVFVWPVWAQGFFSHLPDIPLMEGLHEIEDSSFAFDKPEGRVLGVSAVLADSADVFQVESFYDSVLPQFGWSKAGEHMYVRAGETLHFVFEDTSAEILVKVTIAP